MNMNINMLNFDGCGLAKDFACTNINQLHENFVKYGQNAKEWMRKCIFLLPEIEKYQIWKEKGFGSIYEYAGKLAGMSRGQVEEALRVLRRISDKPALMKILEEKGLQRVRPVAAIATLETQNFWAEKSATMPKNTLETYVKNYREEFLPREGHQSGNHQTTDYPIDLHATDNSTTQTSLTHQTTSQNQTLASLTMNLDPETLAELEALKGQSNWDDLMKTFILAFKEKQVREKYLKQQKPESIKTKSRSVPAKIEQYVLIRSNGKCEFPNCNKKHEHLHHTNRFASDHTHDPDNIVALCKAHHDLAHHGLIADEQEKPQNWKIRKEKDFTILENLFDEQYLLHRRK